MFLLSLALAGGSSAHAEAEPSFAADPVVMENEVLRLTIDRGRGGVISRAVYKPLGRDLTEQFHSGEVWAGGLAEDRIAGQPYPNGELNTARYEGRLSRKGADRELALTYASDTEANGGLTFGKAYRLEGHASRVCVEWTIGNRRDTPVTLTPWVHNIVERRLGEITTPTPDGVKGTSSGPDCFLPPHRDWIGALDGETGLFLYFMTEYSKLAKYYYGFWSGGFVGVEWIYTPVTIPPGGSWSCSYEICVVHPLRNVACATPELAAGYRWLAQGLQLDIVSTLPTSLVQVSSAAPEDGGADWREGVELARGAPARLVVPRRVSADGRVALRAGTREDRALSAAPLDPPEPDPVLHLKEGVLPARSPLPAWPGGRSPYREIRPTVRHADRLARGAGLSLWQAEAMTKVYREDPLAQDQKVLSAGARGKRSPCSSCCGTTRPNRRTPGAASPLLSTRPRGIGSRPNAWATSAMSGPGRPRDCAATCQWGCIPIRSCRMNRPSWNPGKTSPCGSR